MCRKSFVVFFMVFSYTLKSVRILDKCLEYQKNIYFPSETKYECTHRAQNVYICNRCIRGWI